MTPTETTLEEPAARMWGLPGAEYDTISFAIGDALAHGAQRLAPAPGAEVLDVATGTGWTARNLARCGARVTACDFAPRLLDAARRLSVGVEPPIRFDLADAAALPYADGAFDGVISTFGVMFAADQRAAAAELARVCRRGGRLVLVAWVPGGAVAKFFALLGRHDATPPPDTNPLDWGDPQKVTALLSTDFELEFEPGTSIARHESEAAIWDWYARGFGPVRHVTGQLGPDGQAALRCEVDAYHAAYRDASGRLSVRRDYLVAIGRRR